MCAKASSATDAVPSSEPMTTTAFAKRPASPLANRPTMNIATLRQQIRPDW